VGAKKTMLATGTVNKKSLLFAEGFFIFLKTA